MAQPRLAAALATDQGMALDLADGFLPDMGIDVAKRRILMEQRKRFCQTEAARRSIEFFVKRADQREVIRGIDADTGVRQRQGLDQPG